MSEVNTYSTVSENTYEDYILANENSIYHTYSSKDKAQNDCKKEFLFSDNLNIIIDFNDLDTVKKSLFYPDSLITDKLRQGVTGLEWLVSNISPPSRFINTLVFWVESERERGNVDYEEAMMKTLIMKHNDYQDIFEKNYWISRDMTLLYLSLIRNSAKKKFYRFMRCYENKIGVLSF